MQDKVNLYYEGQQGRLALRCCMRLVWGDVNFVISAQRYSDSPQEAQVALLETLGQRYINISKEAERHQQRALELEAQLGDALRSAEVARDRSKEIDEELADQARVIHGYRDRLKEVEQHLASAIALGQVERGKKDDAHWKLAEQIETTRQVQVERRELEDLLLQKDERVLDLEREVLNLRQHHDQLMASSTQQWQLRGEEGVKALNAEQRVKELEEQVGALQEDARLLQEERATMVHQLEKLVVSVGVVINSFKKEE